MSSINSEIIYLTSKDAKKLLKVSDCHLAHLRIEGKLSFVKKGNAYLYEEEGIKLMKI